MVDWLYSLPELVLAVLFSVALMVPLAVLPWLIRRLSILKPSPERTSFTQPIASTLFNIASLVLAFSLVQAQGNDRQLDNLATSEAGAINSLDRLLTRYGDAAAIAARPALLAYAEAIAYDEWPAMVQGRDSEAARLAFRHVSQDVLALAPQPGRQTILYAEAVKSLDSIADMREARLSSVSVKLPALYWFAVAFAIGVLVLINCTLDSKGFRTVVLVAQAAVLGLFVGVVFISDHPYKGESGLKPDELVKVIAFMKARDA